MLTVVLLWQSKMETEEIPVIDYAEVQHSTSSPTPLTHSPTPTPPPTPTPTPTPNQVQQLILAYFPDGKIEW